MSTGIAGVMFHKYWLKNEKVTTLWVETYTTFGETKASVFNYYQDLVFSLVPSAFFLQKFICTNLVVFVNLKMGTKDLGRKGLSIVEF